jgi:hypothetical protein
MREADSERNNGRMLRKARHFRSSITDTIQVARRGDGEMVTALAKKSIPIPYSDAHTRNHTGREPPRSLVVCPSWYRIHSQGQAVRRVCGAWSKSGCEPEKLMTNMHSGPMQQHENSAAAVCACKRRKTYEFTGVIIKGRTAAFDVPGQICNLTMLQTQGDVPP